MSLSSFRIQQNTFSMPFGTSIVPEGGVLFRLWAPMAEKVDLCLQQTIKILPPFPMIRCHDGWFSLHCHTAQAGDRYQFRIDGDLLVPDPASRYQDSDVHGPSVICNPDEYLWNDHDWRGRPWEEAVIYELHIGTFSARGTFDSVLERLDYLAELGITAIQLMPVAHFPGRCNWGYDGTLLFAPYTHYGSPDDLKNLVQAAHQRKMMVFLDVVYNHFGPEGNYLYSYAREQFFTKTVHTPWGAAIRFSGPGSRTVRDFFIANSLFWLEEYHFDGLRLDAIHTIFDPSEPDILEEIAQAVQQGPARNRHIHLLLENDNNCARYLERGDDGAPLLFTAQFNDDIHHALHVLLTDECDGYYGDYCNSPIRHLARCLMEGFAYQGEVSSFRNNSARGDPSGHLPPAAFITFLQNHDQVGNRAYGERLALICEKRDLRICTILLLLAPFPPLIFMGEEFGAATPFYYFCDFGPDLAASITAGRREEFAGFPEFSTFENLERIPDPNTESTFLLSKLDWNCLDDNDHKAHHTLYRDLLSLRHREIVPRLRALSALKNGQHILAEKALHAWWILADGAKLSVLFNLHRQAIPLDVPVTDEMLLFQLGEKGINSVSAGFLPPKSIFWLLDAPGGGTDD